MALRIEQSFLQMELLNTKTFEYLRLLPLLNIIQRCLD